MIIAKKKKIIPKVKSENLFILECRDLFLVSSVSFVKRCGESEGDEQRHERKK